MVGDGCSLTAKCVRRALRCKSCRRWTAWRVLEMTAMGALVYRPDYTDGKTLQEASLDYLAQQAQQILSGKACTVLRELLALNASSAGARPKAMIGVSRNLREITCGTPLASSNFEPWLVKFPGGSDGLDAGAIEYVYALMAKAAGIEMQQTHLFAAEKGPGYFATKRFDRREKKRFTATAWPVFCTSILGCRLWTTKTFSCLPQS